LRRPSAKRLTGKDARLSEGFYDTALNEASDG